MKLKLPCCELNKKPPKVHWEWECGYCECVFKKKKLLDGHNHEVHQMQIASKRKMECCDHNEKKRPKLGVDPIACHYCKCTFRTKSDRDEHLKSIHTCLECCEILLTDDERAKHTLRHYQERQLEALEEQRQRKLDDDFLLNFLYGNQLDESDYEPDFDYIFNNFDFEKDELVRIVKKFKSEFLDSVIDEAYDELQLNCADLIYLVENDALSIEDMANLVDNLMYMYFHNEDDVSQLLAYLLDKDYPIKAVWVSKVIDDNALVERIKAKHTFTFREVYGARDRHSFINNEQQDEFYRKVYRHFPDPEIEDPFADPYEDFQRAQTEHVHDHLMNCYYYDEEDDELSIVVGYDDDKREISLGSCAQMSEKSLEELIKEYEGATKVYDELNERVNNLFHERDKELDEALNKNERLDILDYYRDEIYGAAIPDRNDQANIVSKLYFVISMK